MFIDIHMGSIIDQIFNRKKRNKSDECREFVSMISFLCMTNRQMIDIWHRFVLLICSNEWKDVLIFQSTSFVICREKILIIDGFFFFSLAGCALIWLKKSSSTMKLYLRTTPEQTQLIIIIIIIIVSFVRFANRNAFLTLNISKREKATQTNVKNCHSQMQ